jgi:hypothetical protein
MSYKYQGLQSLLIYSICAAKQRRPLKNTSQNTYQNNTRYVLQHSILYSNTHLKYWKPQKITEKGSIAWIYSRIPIHHSNCFYKAIFFEYILSYCPYCFCEPTNGCVVIIFLFKIITSAIDIVETTAAVRNIRL